MVAAAQMFDVAALLVAATFITHNASNDAVLGVLWEKHGAYQFRWGGVSDCKGRASALGIVPVFVSKCCRSHCSLQMCKGLFFAHLFTPFVLVNISHLLHYSPVGFPTLTEDVPGYFFPPQHVL